MRFRINHALIFDDEKMDIADLQQVRKVKLGSIHARCLSCLCKPTDGIRGSLVKKKTLFYEGWEKHGLVSSSNSLAQTIFQLRKILKGMEIPEAILTIPRVGFKINNMLVEPLQDGVEWEPFSGCRSSRFGWVRRFWRVATLAVGKERTTQLSLSSSLAMSFFSGALYHVLFAPAAAPAVIYMLPNGKLSGSEVSASLMQAVKDP